MFIMLSGRQAGSRQHVWEQVCLMCLQQGIMLLGMTACSGTLRDEVFIRLPEDDCKDGIPAHDGS